jgi:hypothetical protein
MGRNDTFLAKAYTASQIQTTFKFRLVNMRIM